MSDGTKIIRCNCTHAYQDKQYGKGRRLANLNNKGGARCTVCGTTKG